MFNNYAEKSPKGDYRTKKLCLGMVTEQFNEKGTTEQGNPSHKGYRTVFCNPGFHTLQHFGPIPGEALKIMIF